MFPSLPSKAIASSLLVLTSMVSHPALAQILPDETLSVPSTVRLDAGSFLIEGGTMAGTNLFHSFEEFSLPTGSEAFFNNAATMENILTRVTGSNISNIDGLIRTNGTANLFLFNPNGIVFGPNARLNIGGSFFGSTADAILFENGVEFSATHPESSPLLSVSVPIGLQLGTNPGIVRNRSIAANSGGNPVVSPDGTVIGGELTFGLDVSPGETIALIGGEIVSDGGFLSAPKGRIELGAGRNTTVELSETGGTWRASYPMEFDRGNVTLSNGAIVSTSGEGGGSIQIFGGNVRLDGPSPSLLLADTLGDLDGEGITIDAANLQLLGGSLIASSSTAGGTGGDIDLRVSGSLQVIGTIEDSIDYQLILLEEAERGDSLSLVEERFSTAGLATGIEFTAEGNPGNINIEAGQVLLDRGSQIDARGGRISIRVDSTLELSIADILSAVIGDRMGGNVEIAARQVIGRADAGIITATFPSSTGPAGDIIIQADLLEWSNTSADAFFPATIDASTVGDSPGGDVTIDVARLVLSNGVTLSTTSGFLLGDGTITPAAGPGGNISIRASESVEVIGESPDAVFASTIGTSALTDSDGGNIRIETPRLLVSDGGRIASETLGAGQGGQIFITASDLTLADRANITVDGIGTGSGGNLNLNVDSLQLHEGSQITATAASGTGGNLTIDVASSLQLRGGSSISAEAGGTGNGGNATINTETIALLENSSITANAFEGNGGNIRLTSDGIFLSSDSDITASSQLGIDGIIEITNPEVDTNAGLIELPKNPIDVSDRVSTGCATRQGSSFVIAGLRGVPETPSELLRGSTVWEDLRPLEIDGFTEVNEEELHSIDPGNVHDIPLVEATSWQQSDRGEVELVASHPQFLSLQNLSNCP